MCNIKLVRRDVTEKQWRSLYGRVSQASVTMLVTMYIYSYHFTRKMLWAPYLPQWWTLFLTLVTLVPHTIVQSVCDTPQWPMRIASPEDTFFKTFPYHKLSIMFPASWIKTWLSVNCQITSLVVCLMIGVYLIQIVSNYYGRIHYVSQ